MMSTISISPLGEQDIPGAVDAIQVSNREPSPFHPGPPHGGRETFS